MSYIEFLESFLHFCVGMYVCLCICEHMSQGDQGTALSFHHVFLGMKPRSLGFVASIFTYCDSLVPLM